MKTLYNEGRVVGLSAYESYIRQLMSIDPDARPLDERTWLSASLSANQSMILKVKAGTERGCHDYPLPSTSDLCGCSVIYASIFEGECTLDESGNWAIRVDDYGRLISNTADRHPVTPGMPGVPGDVPTKINPTAMPEYYKNICREYLKITSAIMLQPGEWESNIQEATLVTENDIPVTDWDDEELIIPWNEFNTYASFKPDLSKPGFIRLGINQDIEHDVYIILTGFSYKTLVHGEVGYDKLGFSQFPEDGDFLGPARFPWGCKIILTLTSDITNLMIEDIRSEIQKIIDKDATNFEWHGTRDAWSRLSPAAQALYRYVSIVDE